MLENLSFAYAGETYHFCCDGCHSKFSNDPELYLDPERKAAAEKKRDEQPPGTIYGCPMCPGQEQEGPGICAVCGMALEPMGPA